MYAVVDKNTDQVELVSTDRRVVLAEVAELKGLKHPPAIFEGPSAWSEAARNKIGVYSVPDAPDGRFTTATPDPATYDPATDKVTVTYSTSAAPIAEARATVIEEMKLEARELLNQTTDWLVIRNVETGAAIPAAVTQYRADMRAATATFETQINAASIADLEAMTFTWPEAPAV